MVGTRGLRLIFSLPTLGGVGAGRANCGWRREVASPGVRGPYWRLVLLCGAPLEMAIRVWACLAARGVDLGGGALLGSPRPYIDDTMSWFGLS
jgi:hypothetical protein